MFKNQTKTGSISSDIIVVRESYNTMTILLGLIHSFQPNIINNFIRKDTPLRS